MKKRLTAWVLILLILVAFPGCKQETETSAAPGQVVTAPETEPIEEDAPTIVGQEEEETGSNHVLAEAKNEEDSKAELFICKFLIRIKDEFISQNYDESDFSEISISDYSVKTYLYPDGAEEPCASEIIITSKMDNWDLVMKGFNLLKKRNDIQSMSLSYEGYMIDPKETVVVLPNLKRTTFEFNNIEYTDGVIVVELKEDITVSPLLFEDLDIDGLTGELYTTSTVPPRIKLYLKERGQEELSRLIPELENMDFITCAEFDRLIKYVLD